MNGLSAVRFKIDMYTGRRRHEVLLGLWGIILCSVLILSGACAGTALLTPFAVDDPRDRLEEQISSLPESVDRFYLSEEAPPVVFSEENLWEHLDGGAHQYIQIGFDLLLLAWYEEPETKQKVMVEIFIMKSSEAAASIYSQEIYMDGENRNICGRSYSKGNFLFFQNDVYYVKSTAYYYDKFTTKLLKKMACALCLALVSKPKVLPEPGSVGFR